MIGKERDSKGNSVEVITFYTYPEHPPSRWKR
jgi:hypothetical protein